MEYNAIRRKTREVKVGNKIIGGNAPVSVQSMTNTDTCDFAATYRQVQQLEAAGCDIVRLAVPEIKAAETFCRLKNAGIRIPLVADIHFDYRVALECASAGADKIRINPGNIGDTDRVKRVADCCREKGIPIRIGVNSGSLEKHLLAKYGSPTPEALAESAMGHIRLLERFDFTDIIVAIKASDPYKTLAANRLIADMTDYPLHLGVTEAGTAHMGIIKSAAGIGAMLLSGLGDTIRVSLTAPPVLEIKEGKALLAAIGLAHSGVNLISCPTCGRCKIDLIGLASALENRLAEENITVPIPLTVAVMGCAVNGPGEAREADIGIAGGRGEALLFQKGEIIRKIPEGEIIETLLGEIKSYGKNIT